MRPITNQLSRANFSARAKSPAKRAGQMRMFVPALFGGVLSLLLVAGSWVTPAVAEVSPAVCPNQPVRVEQVHGVELPDCRSYEQVSPVEKDGVDAEGAQGNVQASVSGERIRYYSNSPFAECSGGGFSKFPEYLSSRGREGEWSTACVTAPGGFSEELSEALLPSNERFAGFAADEQYVIFESLLGLEGAVAGVPNLYEENLESKQLSLVGMVPPPGESSCATSGPVVCEISPGGATAGAGGPVAAEAGASAAYYTQSAISGDGSRVFFTALPSGRIYLREDSERTVAVSPGPAVFREATPDGEYVFYTEDHDLYQYDSQSHKSETVATPVTAEGKGDVTVGTKVVTELHRGPGEFRVGEDIFGEGIKRGTRITAVGASSLTLSLEPAESVSGDALSGEPAGVLGVLGASSDGSIVYFAAAGVLAESENSHGEVAASEPETANLYESYLPPEGAPAVTTFVSRLDYYELPFGGDNRDWNDFLTSFPQEKTSRVTPDGGTALFTSYGALLRYRAGADGAVGRLTCVSCNPEGPSGEVLLAGTAGGIEGSPEVFMTRNLSEDGDRVFFETAAKLPGDVNTGSHPGCYPIVEGEVTGCNVYEWEAPGEGSCVEGPAPYYALDEGCLFLISSGTSTEQSYFGDASANGDDVFFFTRQALVRSDDDENVDVYDASVDGGACGVEGFPPCPHTPKLLPPCRTPEECEPEASEPPVESLPASATFGGPGNLVHTLEGTTHTESTTKPLTSAQKLAKALRACRKRYGKSKKKRAKCETAARMSYRSANKGRR